MVAWLDKLTNLSSSVRAEVSSPESSKKETTQPGFVGMGSSTRMQRSSWGTGGQTGSFLRVLIRGARLKAWLSQGEAAEKRRDRTARVLRRFRAIAKIFLFYARRFPSMASRRSSLILVWYPLPCRFRRVANPRPDNDILRGSSGSRVVRP
jgi:hypothetical protein